MVLLGLSGWLGSALAGCLGGGVAGSIGVVARRDELTGRTVVVDVPAGSTGARAGFEVGDEILAVDGVSVAGMSREDFLRHVRGPVGTKVVVHVRRDGAVHRLTVERAAMREVAHPSRP
jgi:carboxyl-terminal processing protease